MQQLENMRFVLKTLYLLGKMPRGAGWATPREIIVWSGVKHSTTYRLLPKLVKLGYLEVEEYKCRKIVCRRYRGTSQIVEFLDSFGEYPIGA